MSKTVSNSLVAYFRDVAIIACGVWAAAFMVQGIPQNLGLIFFASCLISFLNAFLRPLLIAKLLPLVIAFVVGTAITNFKALAGKIVWVVVLSVLALWLINGFIFWVAFFLAGAKILFGAALWGSVWTSLATLFICAFFGIRRENLSQLIFNHLAGTPGQSPEQPEASAERRERRRGNDDDVIDI
ncbi:MAG: hypothetical protein K6B46_04585 [Opitutales bacterium]|nr:hypothetical protein [Opitutales bacterium]